MTLRKLRALLLLVFALLAPVGVAACGTPDVEGEIIHGDHGDDHGDEDHGAEDDHGAGEGGE